MKLMLMRHAEAEDGSPDPDRQLTDFGRATSYAMASFAIKTAAMTVSQIWCSPYKRARETSEPFRELLGDSTTFVIKDWLKPEGNPDKILTEIRNVTDSVLIIGHNPLLAALVGKLIGQSESGLTGFRKGALFIFKRNPRLRTGFRLEGYIPPSAIGKRK